jgi:hypothetical protein
MDAFVTVVPAQPRQRAPSPPRAMTQLLISDLRKVAPVETATRAVDALRAALDAPPAELLAALEAVGRFYFSLELLEDTGAGVLVHRLRAHADGGVAARAEGLYAQWRADAKAAVLRREKRRSKEGADADGKAKKKSRTPGAGGSSSAAADGIDRDADDARDARRDFMVAPELDLAREVEEWEAASAHAATRKPYHHCQHAPGAAAATAAPAADGGVSAAAAAPSSSGGPQRLQLAGSSSSSTGGRRLSAPGLLPVSALPNLAAQQRVAAGAGGGVAALGSGISSGSGSSAPRRQSLPIAAQLAVRPTLLHTSPAGGAATTSSSSSSSAAGLTLLPAAAAPSYPALQLLARPSPAAAAAAHGPRLSLPATKQ